MVSEDKLIKEINELPREIVLKMYTYIYNKWETPWRKVMKELLGTEEISKILPISRCMRKEWDLKKRKQYTICIDCGQYYQLPLYSNLSMYCECP
jgi:hypothetical protein